MIWQGGFLFYAAIVVRIGQRVLGSHFAQGEITQQVTIALNGVGAAALTAMVPELLRGERLRRLLWGAMLALLVALFVLHRRLDVLLASPLFERDAFYPWHRAYLWVSTAQWLIAMVFSVLSLRAWAAQDVSGGE